MRHASGVAGGLLLSTVLFSSCTCHKQVSQPPTFSEPRGGFHAAQRTAPPAQAQAPTATAAQLAEPAATPLAGMPEDFPKDVPVYKDAALSQVQDLANNAHNVIFTTAAPVSDVAAFYQNKMTGAGWRVSQQFQRSNHAFMTFQKGELLANVTIAEDTRHPGQQVIAIMYEKQKPLDFDEF
jgi:hypothetical protein